MSEYIVCPHCYNPLSQSEYVKVMRCRDCEHYDENDAGCSYFVLAENNLLHIANPDGFCSWGKRNGAEQ